MPGLRSADLSGAAFTAFAGSAIEATSPEDIAMMTPLRRDGPDIVTDGLTGARSGWTGGVTWL